MARTTLVSVAVLLSFLACEGILRLAGYEYSPLRIKLEGSTDWRSHHAFEDRHFIYDSELIWRPRPSSEVFNDQGYRGALLSATRPEKEARIFAIGDSNTLGWSGQNGANWPKYLDEFLNQSARSSVVINAGVYGYSSYQGLGRFKQTLAFDPDMVLISFGGNDAHRTLVSDANFVSKGLRKGQWDKFLIKAKLGQMLLAVLDGFSGANAQELIPRVSVEEYEANLREIIRICRDRGIKVVLLTRPFTGSSHSPLWWKNFAPDYNKATLDIGKQEEVMTIDVYSHFKSCEACFADESHFTEDGHKLAAKLIFEHIEKHVAVRER